jgi:hypothetical protein
MLRRRTRKNVGMALVAGFLMGFSAILHPKGAQMEDARDETRRKKDAQSGEPVDPQGGNASLRQEAIR